jgi:hypothetical protein
VDRRNRRLTHSDRDDKRGWWRRYAIVTRRAAQPASVFITAHPLAAIREPENAKKVIDT